MPRPHEPFADAIRLARAIVEVEGAALARVWDGNVANDDDRIDLAKEALVRRIAEAVADAELSGREWSAERARSE